MREIAPLVTAEFGTTERKPALTSLCENCETVIEWPFTAGFGATDLKPRPYGQGCLLCSDRNSG